MNREIPYDTRELAPASDMVDGPVKIDYLFTESADHHHEVVFRITNSGPDPVQFRRCRLAEGNWPGLYAVGAGGDCLNAPDHLEPFQSTTLRASSGFDSRQYWLSVKYSVAYSETEQRADIYVTRPRLDRP